MIVVLHNLHALILKKKCVKKVDDAGDGTGYSLTIKTHYASAAQKLKDKIKDEETQSEHKKRLFIYSFCLMDIITRMYIGFGTSFKNEKDAFEKALQVAQQTGIQITRLRLDKYYSAEAYLKILPRISLQSKSIHCPKKQYCNNRTWRLEQNDL